MGGSASVSDLNPRRVEIRTKRDSDLAVRFLVAVRGVEGGSRPAQICCFESGEGYILVNYFFFAG